MSDSSKAPSSQIVDHFEDPFNRGRCEFATHVAEATQSLCPDTIVMQLRIDPDTGVIEEAWFDGDGCQTSQAAASILTERIEGAERSEIEQLSAADALELFDPPLASDQLKCGLLAWRVLQAALASPVDEFEDDAPHFGGPHLGEEN